MTATSIEWTEHSLNPIRSRIGQRDGHYCEKISPGCKNCYASRLQPRFGLPVFTEQRSLEGRANYFEPKILEQVLARKKPTKWFWCDMSDMFGDWVPFEWIAACFAVMAATPHHTHQVLTKRPARALEFFAWVKGENKRRWHGEHGALWESLEGIAPALATPARWKAMYENAHGVEPPTALGDVGAAFRWPLRNVWLGVSAEDQKTADERVPLLLRCPAAVHWVSAEPLLQDLDLRQYVDGYCPGCRELGDFNHEGACERVALSWAVVGGESGGGARPFDLMWARRLVTDFHDAGVPIFVKQVGKKPFDDGKPLQLGHRKGGGMDEWPREIRVRRYPAERA